MYDTFLYVMKVFGAPNYFRLILTAPVDKTREACERIVEFCMEHLRGNNMPILRRIKSVVRKVGDVSLAKKE